MDGSKWCRWKKQAWCPSNCTTRYATLYPLPVKEEKEEEAIEEPESTVIETQSLPTPGPWCACCMREACEPISLKCSHTFCRRCLVEIGRKMLTEFSHTLQDSRATMKCPMSGCLEQVPCLPFVNGDFRFHKRRKEGKVIEQKELTPVPDMTAILDTYRIVLDADVTLRKSDELFAMIYKKIEEKRSAKLREKSPSGYQINRRLSDVL